MDSEIEKAKEQIRVAKEVLKNAKEERNQRWRESLINNFIDKLSQSELEKKTQRKEKVDKIIENAIEKICNLIPDEKERTELISSFGN